jgi:NADH dehydrogenase
LYVNQVLSKFKKPKYNKGMNHDIKNVTVFGGSGFIGRYVVEKLAAKDCIIRVPTRSLDKAKFLKPLGDIGQIVPVPFSLNHPESIARAVDGADAVINLTGILYEKGKNTFERVHHQGAMMIASAAASAGVKRLIHVSAIGADPNSPSKYAQSKYWGEQAVREVFPNVTILRPSIVFGPEDNFFNLFASLGKTFPFLPLIGGGDTRFQPVYVGDVAEAAVMALEMKETARKVYELGGPRVYSFRELMELMRDVTGQNFKLINVPYWAANIKAFFLEFMPRPLLTRDQIQLLKIHNVATAGAGGFRDLRISPTALEVILPSYMDKFMAGGRFRNKDLEATI